MKKIISDNKHVIYIALCVIAFALVTLVYFSPVIQGKRIKQHDIEMYKGMSKEIVDFKAETGQQSLWTNSMFGGMPAWNIGVPQNTNLMTYVNRVLAARFPHPIGAVFISMLGFFVLLMVLGCKIWISFIGALAYGFTSYLFIVIGAGHNSKAFAMAYMAPVIAGVLLTYKGKYLWGAALTALALALEIRAGHLQITYYLLLIVVCIVIAELVETIKEKKYLHFIKASGILAGVAVVAILTCTTTLYANYEFGKETMRGKPVLTRNVENQTNGLDRDYVTQWSYGIGETWSLMIPNAKGGASGYIGNNNDALEKCTDARFRPTIAQQNAYWGDQPITSGPVYVGAIVCFLFVFGLFVVKGKYKWMLLAATVLSVLLSWGKNFMGFTDFFLDYIPGYSKFRAVSMTLVIAEVCMPLLAFLALAELFKTPDALRQNKRYLYISLGITGGLCLLFYVLPQTFFNFLSASEAAQFKQMQTGQDGALYTAFANELENVRVAIFRKDAIRSFLYIGLAAVLILLSVSGKMNKNYMFVSVALLVVLDMFTIDKRYLNDSDFIAKSKAEKPFVMDDVDRQIKKDQSLDYRVVNLTVSTFNDASTSYFHKSVGGYHGAKLRRYQDIISQYLSRTDNNYMKVLNMLNTKYLIYQRDNKKTASVNGEAFGNAWIVSDIKWVATPNDEIDAIATTDVRNVAIINDEFRSLVGDFNISPEEGTITLTDYKPNQLTYSFDSSKDELVVFSEIWTKKGWTMWIDGVESPLMRADYILRSAIIPSGNHQIVMRYEPRIWKVGNAIQLIASLLILLGFAAVCYITYKKREVEA